MTILHTITYTIYSSDLKAHVESTTTLSRSSRLTYAGAQRILRKSIKDAVVTRIETMIDAR